MNGLFIFLQTILLISRVSSSYLPPSPPPFSWDTIPLFIHADYWYGPLNDTAAEYMASFPLATIEKGQGQDNRNPICSEPCAEDKMIAAGQKIRSYSNDTRIIFYMNSALNWYHYDLYTQFMLPENQQYLMHDADGSIVWLPECEPNLPNITLFDLSQNETVNMWLDTVRYAMTKYPGVIDGIFVDRGSYNMEWYHFCINMTTEKAKAWNAGHTYMIQKAQEIITELNPERGILIINNENFDETNGRMFENFRYYDTWSANDVSRDGIVALRDNKGKRITEIHGKESWGAAPHGSFIYNQTVSAYLIGAYEYSYYASTYGWTLSHGWDEMWQNPDYQKALGDPLGDGVLSDGVWFREFQSGTRVYIDSEWNYPCIIWSDGTFTGTQTDCNRYPTLTPTYDPTQAPTNEPTIEPSNIPSSEPSMDPTEQQSVFKSTLTQPEPTTIFKSTILSENKGESVMKLHLFEIVIMIVILGIVSL